MVYESHAVRDNLTWNHSTLVRYNYGVIENIIAYYYPVYWPAGAKDSDLTYTETGIVTPFYSYQQYFCNLFRKCQRGAYSKFCS